MPGSVSLYVTGTDEVKLSAAHVTGGNVELIQPLKVTNTRHHRHSRSLLLRPL